MRFVLLFLAAVALIGAVSCSDDEVTCGAGTALVDGVCVADGSVAGGGGTGDAGGTGGTAGAMEDGGAGGSGGIANTPPTFAGITSVSPANESVLLVTWAPASDDSTASEAILYHVYVADSAGGQSFDTPTLTTAPGASSVQLTGLDSATTILKASAQ